MDHRDPMAMLVITIWKAMFDEQLVTANSPIGFASR